ncbi:MAG: hypothetical protein ACLTFG_03475 [Veillonella atypica]
MKTFHSKGAIKMVELTIVMNCGTGTYETETFEDKKTFERAIQNVQLEHDKLICFTDTRGRFISVSPANCIIECTELKR